jgi:hypothetical protein
VAGLAVGEAIMVEISRFPGVGGMAVGTLTAEMAFRLILHGSWQLGKPE